MFGLKVIAVILLVGAVAPTQANPQPTDVAKSGSGGLLGDLVNGLLGVVGKILGTLDKVLGDYLGKCTNQKGIIDILNYLIKLILKFVKQTLKEVVNLVYILLLILRGILDGIAYPLGKIVFTLIGALFQYGICYSNVFGNQGNHAICKYGMDPKCGLSPGLDGPKCQKVMEKGCTDLQSHYEQIQDKEYTGLIGFVVNVFLPGVLDICVGINLKEILKSVSRLLEFVLIFLFGCANNYGILNGLLGNLLAIVAKLLGVINIGIDIDFIQSECGKCGSQYPGIHEYKNECFG